MRPRLFAILLVTFGASSLALGDDTQPPRRFVESTTLNASLKKSQTTKTVFATVKVTGEVGADE